MLWDPPRVDRYGIYVSKITTDMFRLLTQQSYTFYKIVISLNEIFQRTFVNSTTEATYRADTAFPPKESEFITQFLFQLVLLNI